MEAKIDKGNIYTDSFHRQLVFSLEQFKSFTERNIKVL